jgi:hypothetical protein
MRDASPWTRFNQGISQNFQRTWSRLSPARDRVQESWRSLSLAYKLLALFLIAVGIGFLIILGMQGFPWDALSITALSQAPWHIGR